MTADARCHATIAICTYNRLRTLPATLQALSMLRGPYSFEVLVVNGPSDDGTAAYLAGCPGIRVLDNPDTNLAISRNIAIANAAGDFIAFIDDDAIPEADWLTLILDSFAADPGLDAIGGFIRDANGISFQARYVFCDVFGTGYPCDNPDYATFLGREKRLYSSLTGTNVVFRATALRDLGGFDEAFAYFLDETDVNKRMDDQGLRMAVIPQAEIHHKYAPSHLRGDTRIPTNMLPIARSIAYFAMTHAAPELGWVAVSDRLKDFYRNEFGWKADLVSQGKISPAVFDGLMRQTKAGILQGIDRYFDARPDAAAQAARLTRHEMPKPPVLRQMRPDEAALRLCLFSRDHDHARQGGIARWTRLVAEGLAARGHEVTVIGERDATRDQDYCDYTPQGFWSHNLHDPGGAPAEGDCLGLPPGLARAAQNRLAEFRRVMPRRRFQVASTPIWDVEGAALIGAGDVPNVLSLHTCAGLMLQSKPEWRENQAFYHGHVLRVIGAEIQALRRADMILANSQAILRDISDIYGLDLFTLPHVVVPHGIEDISHPEGVLEARIAAAAPLRILFLGRIETRKGIGHLVPALQALLASGRDVRVDIVGEKVDDANMALLQGLLDGWPGHVTWHGFLPQAGIDALMRAADIFVAPSLYESFGLIYVEAQRYALPSVGFAAGGVPEVVTDGVDGLLAPTGNDAALFAALAQLVDDADLRHRLSGGARASYEQRFGLGLMAERLETVYRDAAASGRRHG
ncbi:MAG: glycosyltransferase [Paracoccaceae bacterium]